MKIFPINCFLAAWLCLSAPAFGADVPLTLNAAVAEALSANPALAMATQQAEGMAYMPRRMGALPDPKLKLGAMNVPTDSLDLDQEPMTQLQVGISQMLPYPGKRGLMSIAARHDARAASAAVQEKRLALVRNVSAIWWHLYHLDRAIEIVTRNRELLEQFVTVARTKYRVGQGLQQDVLLAEVELSRLLDRHLELVGEQGVARARFAALLGWSGERSFALPDTVEEPLPDVQNIETLFGLARENRPRLAAARERTSAADARLRLAQKDHLPDVMVSATYGYRSGQNMTGEDRSDFATLMLSVDLPLHKGARQDQLVAQRQSEAAAGDYGLTHAENAVRAELAEAHIRYLQAREQVSLLKEGIIPQASQTVASMLSGYQVNKVDFLNLVRSQITLYDYETRYWKILSEARGALARLTAAAGVKVTVAYIPGVDESMEGVAP